MKKLIFLSLLVPFMFVLMSFQEPTNRDELKKLDWLIGQWIDQDEEAELSLDYNWDENENFITNQFTIRTKETKILTGKQIIGWDPDKKTIRSWVFDSDGGFGQGMWLQKGEKWIVEAAYTLSNGESASAINVYTKIDKDSYSFESTGRSIDGEILPDVEPVTVIRKKG
jgi:hypothetical protein